MMLYQKIGAAVLFTLCAQALPAQNPLTDVLRDMDVSGYFVGRYQYSNPSGSKSDGGFDLRMARVTVSGSVLKEWKYKVQVEVSGAPGVDKGPRVLDAYGEWSRWAELCVRFGQMKRPFSFENPYTPWNVGWGNYSQVVTKLAGFNDRVGEHASGGRDAGLVVQGDLFTVSTRRMLHYQVGVFNGQGINHSDANKQKDLIGGIWVRPAKGLQVGAFGWTGRYTANGQRVARNRMAYGVKYESDWDFRAEYITSQGRKSNDLRYASKADGWYANVGIPLSRKWKACAVWDVYRDEKSADTQSSNYVAALNYTLCKGFMMQASYFYTVGRTVSYTEQDERMRLRDHYNTLQLQLYVAF